jgi:hypothetical protein
MSLPILPRFICELPMENVIVLPDAESVHEDDKIKKGLDHLLKRINSNAIGMTAK